MVPNELFSASLLSPLDIAPGYKMRPLHRHDWQGFAGVLKQLSDIGDLNQQKFESAFDFMKSSGSHFVVVIEKEETKRVAATGTLLIERKFLRGGGWCGHIEDVVVDEPDRGFNLGFVIIEQLKRLSISKSCYKICLDCNPKNVAFYEKLGFTKKELQMVIYTQYSNSKL